MGMSNIVASYMSFHLQSMPCRLSESVLEAERGFKKLSGALSGALIHLIKRGMEILKRTSVSL